MKVQCDVCDRNRAAVMCCADDAALCVDCDSRVHAANKLAYKHHRVSLTTPPQAPRCDICQEKTGYFFCLEDRALLCRDCDLSIHSVNTLSSNHQRFLLPGIRVALMAIAVPDTPQPASQELPQCRPPQQNLPQFPQYEVSQCSIPSNRIVGGGRRASPMTDMNSTGSPRHPQFSPQFNNVATTPARIQGGQGNFVPSRNQGTVGLSPRTIAQQNSNGQQNPKLLRRSSSITEFLTEGVPGWTVDNLLSFADIADGYTTSDLNSSKADMGNLGDFDWAADLGLFDEVYYEDAQHEVPQMPSPPTASGLSRGSKVCGAVKGNLKQESALVPDFDSSFLVPDLGLQHSSPPASPPSPKRRRNFYVY